MSRTSSKIIRHLAPALVVAAVVAPSASASERTATELAQSTGATPAAAPSGGPSERTATELAQAVGEPGDASGTEAVQTSARTATELAQAVGEPGDAVQPGDYQNLGATGSESGGFDWGDFAIVAGGAAFLIGIGGIVLFTRRRDAVRRSRTPVVSS
jgi:hypothetical protein